ncbi:MAG: DUF1080 domain-containing protein [Gemmatimonadaceae bacterium]|nr:DUF1080 domain-containing protein [Gemmatimonadaceae bacterium]
MRTPTLRAPLLGALLLLSFGCAGAQARPAAAPTPGPWVNLLEGGPAKHWRGYRMDSLPSAWAYDAATGILTRTRMGGDIITREQYTDFELEVEWKVGPKGNSGIFYHATEETAVIYENAPEMQILDNAGHNDGKNTLTSAGANYALDAPVRDVSHPAGEWNAARIVVRGDHVEHWLNGERIVEYRLWTPEWTAKVKASKFAQWPPYGLARRGHIGLQEHGDVVQFRNLRIRELSR